MANKLFLNFVGGMNPKTAPLILKDSECELALNIILDKFGALQKRGGYGARTVGQANKQVNGLFNFIDVSAGNNIPLMVSDNSGSTNGVIRYLDSGSWADGKTNDTAGKRSYFFSLVDYAFRVNGADVPASSANGATWGTTNLVDDETASALAITPKYGAVFQDRGYLANGGSTNKSRVWFSNLPSSGAITWDTGSNWFDVNPDDSDEITALENNGNRLLIFKKNAMYRWSFGIIEPDRLIGVGTQSQDSVKTNFDIGITFFANQKGVYAYSGARPRLISRKIQPFIDAVSDWTVVYGGVDDDHYYLSVGNVTVDGRTYTNAVFCYHISLDAWTIFTTGHRITPFAVLNGVGSGAQLCFGATDGATYLAAFRGNAANGTAPYTADHTTPITSEFISKEYMLSFPKRTNVTWVDIFATRRGNNIAFFDFDRQGDFRVELGQLTQRITNFRPPQRECNSIRLKIMDVGTSTEQQFSIVEGFNIQHEIKEKRDETRMKIRATGYGSDG